MERTARKKIIAKARHRAHHLWKAADDNGRPIIRRERPEEDEMESTLGLRGSYARGQNVRPLSFAEKADLDEPRTNKVRKQEEMPIQAQRRTGSSKVAPEDLSAVYWGLFGASLVDDKTLSSEIPRAIASRFNVTTRTNAGVTPQVYDWEKLSKVFGEEKIAAIRKDISKGIQTRLASKYFNVPFLAAAEIVYDMDANHEDVRGAISMIRQGNRREAESRYGELAVELSKVYDYYKNPVNRKLAIDTAAKDYWEAYMGPFGKEMVREIKKRVRADLAQAWLRKHGVDDAAAKYWSDYYGAYGAAWVSVVPKLISPKKTETPEKE
jgi:hypothetical protein